MVLHMCECTRKKNFLLHQIQALFTIPNHVFFCASWKCLFFKHIHTPGFTTFFCHIANTCTKTRWKLLLFFALSRSRFDVKRYFWCDNRINFKAHLNWISVGAKKCLAFFSHSNPILNYGQPTVEQMIWLICSFFSFARCVEFIFWLAYEFAKCLQHSLFSALIFWMIFFWASFKPFLRFF